MRLRADFGNIGGNGWAVSLDVGPLAIIAGDLVGRYGLRLVWYRGKWAYALEVSTSRVSISEEKA